MKYKIHSINPGFCRIHYVTRNDKNESLYYCLQDDGRGADWANSSNGIVLYRCSKDWEPSYPINFKLPARELMEIPTGDSELELKAKEWIETHEPAQGASA
jgi:hypothetical protein